ncbi:hypothetical protein AAY473_021046 [Plecturocebus cupreus]
MVKPCIYQKFKTKQNKNSQAWWDAPVVPATQEVEVRGSLDPGSQRLQRAEITSPNFQRISLEMEFIIESLKAGEQYAPHTPRGGDLTKPEFASLTLSVTDLRSHNGSEKRKMAKQILQGNHENVAENVLSGLRQWLGMDKQKASPLPGTLQNRLCVIHLRRKDRGPQKLDLLDNVLGFSFPSDSSPYKIPEGTALGKLRWADHLRSVRDQPDQHSGDSVSTKNTRISRVWQRAPVIPATREAEAGEVLAPKRWRSQ